jgi:hypothetical protein
VPPLERPRCPQPLESEHRSPFPFAVRQTHVASQSQGLLTGALHISAMLRLSAKAANGFAHRFRTVGHDRMKGSIAFELATAHAPSYWSPRRCPHTDATLRWFWTKRSSQTQERLCVRFGPERIDDHNVALFHSPRCGKKGREGAEAGTGRTPVAGEGGSRVDDFERSRAGE